MTKHDLSLRAEGGRHAADLLAYRTLRASVGLSRLTSLGLIALGLGLSWLLVYAAGGAGALAPHFYYLPVLFAATRFGPFIALATGVAATILAGPMMPEFVATGEAQETFQWATRGAFFIGIGQLSAWLLAPSIRPITDELQALQIEHRIRRALAHNEFRLVYQPIYSISSSSYVGVEALIRWEHPTHGNIPPDEFTGVAEETDLIHDITDFVLDQACRAGAQWRDIALARGQKPFHMAVNLSARDIERPELARTIETTLERYQLPAELLHLELTESVLALQGTGFQLRQLKKLGITLSIDDFGTGYSSLSYLDRFPFDIIKIDRSLVSNMGANVSSQGLARGMIALSGSLDMLTIAEGIETREQLAIARDIGFDLVQGFLFSRPRPSAEIPALVTANVDPLQMHAESAGTRNEP